MHPYPDFAYQNYNVCLACGFCCDGTIFNKVQLEERDNAGKLSLFQITSEEGNFYFHQPCFAFDRTKGCRIYEARPIKCRMYSCKLLFLLENKKISWRAARDLIEQTRQLKNDLIKEVKRKNIDNTHFTNTRNLVDYIKSDLSSQEHQLNFRDVHLKCAAFSGNLLEYFMKDRSAD